MRGMSGLDEVKGHQMNHPLGVRQDGSGTVVTLLTDEKGNIVTNVKCPVMCGKCCEMWTEVAALKKYVLERFTRSPCPHLGDRGCKLPRADRPIECIGFVCQLGLLALGEGTRKITKAEIKRTIKANEQYLACYFLGLDLRIDSPRKFE
jgi:hypothetical protein